jgi:hypothetical protein
VHQRKLLRPSLRTNPMTGQRVKSNIFKTLSDVETEKSGSQSRFINEKNEKGNSEWNYEPGAHQKNYSQKQGGPAKGLNSELRQIRGKIQQKQGVLSGLYGHAGMQM